MGEILAKPHIFKPSRAGGMWECSGDGGVGIGFTPAHAYALWKQGIAEYHAYLNKRENERNGA